MAPVIKKIPGGAGRTFHLPSGVAERYDAVRHLFSFFVKKRERVSALMCSMTNEVQLFFMAHVLLFSFFTQAGETLARGVFIHIYVAWLGFLNNEAKYALGVVVRTELVNFYSS